MSRFATPASAALLGLYSAAVALAPSPMAAAALGLPLIVVPLSWWILLGANHWLAAFLAAAVLLPPLPIPIGNAGPHPALLFAIAGAGIGVLRARQWTWRFSPLALSIAAFFAILLASVGSAALISGWALAAGSLVRVLLFGISVYVYYFTAHGPGRDTTADPLRAIRWLFAAATLAAAFACFDFYFQLPAPAGYGDQFIWLASGVFRRAQGLFYEASTLGNFCAFFLVMIAVVASQPRGERILPRSVLALAGAIFFAALVFSYSRGSVAALAVSLAALFFLRRGVYEMRRWFIVVSVSLFSGIAVVFLAFPAFGHIYWARLTGSLEFLFSNTNKILSGRLESWSTLAGVLQDKPWYLISGVGYKTLPYSEVAGGPLVADNMYLSLLLETGAAGLAAFLWMNVCILRAAYRAAVSGNGKAAFAGTWIFCFWVGEMLQMLSGDLFTYWRVLPLYFWVLAVAVRLSPASHEDFIRRPIR